MLFPLNTRLDRKVSNGLVMEFVIRVCVGPCQTGNHRPTIFPRRLRQPRQFSKGHNVLIILS